jgi:ParB family transcriptional regulator, chromosome partitioning protein
MKAADQLMARLSPNMRESMGPAAPVLHGGARDAVPPAGGVLHGGAEKYKGAARIKDALAIKLEQIAPDPDQPRKEFDPESLAELAASLKARGQLQPIRVRWDEGLARWVIISGERRYRAALLAGLPTLACIEAGGPLTPDDILEDQLVENALREDLRPIEQARAFRALLDRRGCSIRQLAESLHVSNQSIVRALGLLELPADVQGRVEAGELAPSVAYEVSRLDDAEAQREVAGRVVAEGLQRDEVVEVVREASGRSAGGGKAKGRGAKAKPRKVTSRTLRTSAGYRITVEHRRGIDDGPMIAALFEAAEQLRAALQGRGEAAA